MLKIRLKGIQLDTDFRYSEMTNLSIYEKRKIYPGPLGKRDVFLFISKSGNQLLWILNSKEIETKHKNQKGSFKRKMIDTRRWRIAGGAWNYRMIQNYANEVGLEIVGFKRLEEQYTR